MSFFRKLIKKMLLGLENLICKTPPQPPPMKVIAGVLYWVIYHGKIMAGPNVATDPHSRYTIGILARDEKGKTKTISLVGDCVYGNLNQVFPIGGPLYEARFFELLPGKKRVPHRIFFNAEPTPEQILPFIPETMRNNDDPGPETTGASPEIEVTN